MSLELPDVDHLDDVRVAEPDQRADLALEPTQETRPLERVLRGDREFQHDVGFEMMIKGAEDLPHAPFADPPEDLVSARAISRPIHSLTLIIECSSFDQGPGRNPTAPSQEVPSERTPYGFTLHTPRPRAAGRALPRCPPWSLQTVGI